MRIPRIYHPYPLIEHSHCQLMENASHHVANVLRMRIGEKLDLFDGSNHAYSATITRYANKKIEVVIEQQRVENRESCLNIHLGQVISRGEKMEFTIQKSVELGVNAITPLLSERCGVKLSQERMQKKIQQWQKIVIAACEQCGRNIIPEIRPFMPLQNWCLEKSEKLKLVLNPKASHSIKQLIDIPSQGIRLLIGAEGGLSEEELLFTKQCEFKDVLLGNRILRTETASLVAITALQTCFGDLG